MDNSTSILQISTCKMTSNRIHCCHWIKQVGLYYIIPWWTKGRTGGVPLPLFFFFFRMTHSLMIANSTSFKKYWWLAKFKPGWSLFFLADLTDRVNRLRKHFPSTNSAQDNTPYDESIPGNATAIPRGSHANSFDHDRGWLEQGTATSAVREAQPVEGKTMPLPRLSQGSAGGQQQEFDTPRKQTTHATARRQTEPQLISQRSPNVSSQQPKKAQSGPLLCSHQPSHEGSHSTSATPHYDRSSQPMQSSLYASGKQQQETHQHDPAAADPQLQCSVQTKGTPIMKIRTDLHIHPYALNHMRKHIHKHQTSTYRRSHAHLHKQDAQVPVHEPSKATTMRPFFFVSSTNRKN